MSGHLNAQIEELREMKDGLAELADTLNMCCTSAETIIGYLMINGKNTQITLKAETDQDEWISD